MTLLIALAILLHILTPLLWVAAALLWVQTFRAPENVSIRILALGITMLAATTVIRILDEGMWFAALPNNTLGLVNGALQISFFVSVLRGRSAAPRMRGEFALSFALIAVATAAFLLAPPQARASITNTSPSDGVAYAVVFTTVILSYLLYASLVMVYLISRIIPGVRRRVLRLSLWVIAAGMVVQFAAGVLKVGQSMDRYLTGSSDWPFNPDVVFGVLVTVGNLSLVLGALVPIADGAVREIPRMRAQRRAKRALEPLWRALHAEFPELMLELRSPGPGRALYRRVVEIRDGLVLLSPHFDRTVADRAAQRSRDAGEDAEERELTVQAALIRGALEARRAGRPAAQDAARLGPSPGAVSDTQDWQDDAAALVRLARRFDEAPA